MKQKKAKQASVRLWALKISAITLLLAAGFSVASEFIIANLPLFAALIILFILISIGVFFDIIGSAVYSAEAAPFYAMASKKIKGAQQGIKLLQNSEQVSSFCSDVVGDVCGIVSGAAGAAIAVKIIVDAHSPYDVWVSIGLSALVAAVTVGAKAFGKVLAKRENKEIVLLIGRILNVFGIK
jgi:CBS domain containing-hemolysin-like protein